MLGTGEREGGKREGGTDAAADEELRADEDTAQGFVFRV